MSAYLPFAAAFLPGAELVFHVVDFLLSWLLNCLVAAALDAEGSECLSLLTPGRPLGLFGFREKSVHIWAFSSWLQKRDRSHPCGLKGVASERCRFTKRVRVDTSPVTEKTQNVFFL